MVESNQSGGLWPQIYEPFKGFGSRLSEWLTPASDASSDTKAYRISLELPGVSEADIQLSVANDLLTVSGEKSEVKEDKGDTWYFSERQYGAFRRTFRLPSDAAGEDAEAKIKDGVLTIHVPRKSENQGSGKNIEVKKG